MSRKSTPISSLAELYAALPEIFEAANADPSIAMRFLANPLLLAEELGYTLTDEMKHFAARRVRFPSKETYERLVQLENQVWEQAGERFDLDSSDALGRILFRKLKLNPITRGREQPQKDQPAGTAETELMNAGAELQGDEVRRLAGPLPARAIQRGPAGDPLENLRQAHPIMPPLLEYRQLEASRPRLAPREVYERLAQGKLNLPFTRMTLHLKHIPHIPQEEEA